MGFRSFGSRVWDLGLRGLGSKVWGIHCLGFRVYRELEVKVQG